MLLEHNKSHQHITNLDIIKLMIFCHHGKPLILIVLVYSIIGSSSHKSSSETIDLQNTLLQIIFTNPNIIKILPNKSTLHTTQIYFNYFHKYKYIIKKFYAHFHKCTTPKHNTNLYALDPSWPLWWLPTNSNLVFCAHCEVSLHHGFLCRLMLAMDRNMLYCGFTKLCIEIVLQPMLHTFSTSHL